MNAQSPAKPPVFTLWLLRLFAVVLGLFGFLLLLGGGWLAYYGGSFYYATAGALMIASAVLLFLRRRAGAWLYGLTLAFTIVWAIAEVGFDGWQLLPRLLIPVAFGLWIAMPWTQKPLTGRFAPAARVPLRATGLVGATALGSVALGTVLFFTVTERPADPLYQTGFGDFPQQARLSYDGIVGEDWPHFGGDESGGRYSPLTGITPENVSKLEVAWEVDLGNRPAFNGTPIKIGDTLYTCNNNNEVFALDAATGEQRWHFDASEDYGGSCRGVAYHAQPNAPADQACAARIVTGTNMARLWALDAVTGEPCPDFGENGMVDLRVGMGDYQNEFIPGYYRVTSAPAVVRDRIVVGGWITDGQYWGQTSGVVRAFDAVTGEFAWAWDMGNPGVHTEPPEGETYTIATPNAWAPLSADEELGMVFLPMGNATPDFYGPHRREFDDEFSTATVALNAETGALVWSFQTVHHDIWDYDLAAQPTLANLPGENGATRRVVVQATKAGDLFVLDALTGEPVFEVTETPVPQRGAVPEERLSPTQPYSNDLPSFRGATLREADMWGISPLDQLYCRARFAQARYDGHFTPPGTDASIIFPATFGAVNWGSVTIDQQNAVMLVNHNRFVSYMRLVPREEADAMGVEIQPAYGRAGEVGSLVAQARTEYAAYPEFWLTALGVPCIAPPYGLISAVDLETGNLLWSERFGTAKGLGPLGLQFPFAIPMGTPTHGGSMITASGIAFIGASADNFLTAFDLRSGEILWRYELPGGGGTPISYTVDGRQYIAVAAGGQGAIRSRYSTKFVAFALPE